MSNWIFQFLFDLDLISQGHPKSMSWHLLLIKVSYDVTPPPIFELLWLQILRTHSLTVSFTLMVYKPVLKHRKAQELYLSLHLIKLFGQQISIPTFFTKHFVSHSIWQYLTRPFLMMNSWWSVDQMTK